MKFYEEFGHIGQMQELCSEKRSVFIIIFTGLRSGSLKAREFAEEIHDYGEFCKYRHVNQAMAKPKLETNKAKTILLRVWPHCVNARATFREEKRLHHHFHCFSSTCYIRLPFLIFLNSNNSVDLG